MPAASGWLLGIIVLPAVLYVLAFGAGLLVERAARVRLPGPLIAPVGFCLGVAAVSWLAWVDLGWWATFPLLVVLAVAGYALGERTGLRRRATDGWPAALAVYALYVAPVALSGAWSWAGYNFVNDTAVQFLMVDHLTTDGLKPIGVPEVRTTVTEVLSTYLTSSYPTGTHAYLAALTPPLGNDVAVLYQGYLSAMAALAALALVQLGRRSGLTRRLALSVAVLALAANLAYHYAQQGNIKEIGMLAAFLTAAAVGREMLAAERPVAIAGVFGVVAAAALAIYSTAAGPWIAGVAGLVLLCALADRALRRRILPGVLVLGAVFAALAVPALSGTVTFTKTATATVGAGTTIASEIGHLARPLELRQVTGSWLAGDYRLPIPSPTMDTLTWVLAGLCVALLALAAYQAVRRREVAPALLGLTAIAALVLVTPELSPYAEGKVFALASPAILFAALWGAARMGSALPLLAAGLLALGAVASDARAYHWVRLAPDERMRALDDLNDRFAGEGPILVTEFEEYTKYFMRDTVVNANEPLTPAQLQVLPEYGGYVFGVYYDLDLLADGFVQQFPLVALRRAPDASRPPANFERVHRNAFYEVWRRVETPTVKAHVGLQGLADARARASCADIKRLRDAAEPGDELVAARRPPVVRMETAAEGIRPRNWNKSDQEGQVTPGGPGIARAELDFDGGRMRAWVRGSFGREMHVSVDGERVGSVEGINTPAQWLQAGEVDVAPGRHRVELERPGGDLAPGDGAPPTVGPVVFEPFDAQPELLTLAVNGWRSLCGQRLDWVELVRP
jgi:hypothetical protein